MCLLVVFFIKISQFEQISLVLLILVYKEICVNLIIGPLNLHGINDLKQEKKNMFKSFYFNLYNFLFSFDH